MPQMGKQNDLGRLNNGDREREMAICGPVGNMGKQIIYSIYIWYACSFWFALVDDVDTAGATCLFV